MILTISIQMCSGKNAIRTTRTGQRYPGKRFKVWREEATKQLRGQIGSNYHLPYKQRCGFDVDYTPGDKRTRDVPGMADALFSLLVYAGVVKDDGLIRNMSWRELPMNRKEPYVRMVIEEL